MSDFVKEALKELKVVQSNATKESLEVEELIRESKKKTRIYRYGDINIEIRGSVPKSISRLLIEMEAAVSSKELTPKQMVDLEDYFSYTFMAQMCLKEPHNTKEFWAAFDEGTGAVGGISKDIMEQINTSKEKIIEFRKK